jgi:acyl carrier protein
MRSFVSAADSIVPAIEGLLLDDLGLAPELVERGGLFSRSGLDSFDRLRLLALLQERFNVHVEWEDTAPEKFETVKTIATLILDLQVRASARP